jgi:sulfur relay (sulfurtransferase) DsrC/TusE family protein
MDKKYKFIKEDSVESDCSKYDSVQLELGTRVEIEHINTINFIKDYYNENIEFPSNEQIARHIAMDHLDEFGDYYIYLKRMEDELNSKKETFSNAVEETLISNWW